MINKNLIKLTIVSFVLIFVQCSNKNILISNKLKKITLNEICNKQKRFIDKQIEIEGKFMGWADCCCKFVSAYTKKKSKNDQTFMDSDSSCIQVSGLKPEVSNLGEPGQTGKKIILVAKVKTDNSGKFYLEYISTRQVIK